MEERLQYLLGQYQQGRMTLAERLEFGRLVQDSAAAAQVLNFIEVQWLQAGHLLADLTAHEDGIKVPAAIDPALTLTEDGYARVYDRIKADMQVDQATQKETATVMTHRVHFLRKWWWAAASLILLSIAVAYLLLRTGAHDDVIVDTRPGQGHEVPVQPGKDGAILTLADGRQVVLDSLGNGRVATENGTQVILRNGMLVYDKEDAAGKDITYNTMTTPRGRQFQLQLPDGTRVWLNAASSITYPTAFADGERDVSITGEAYFEVTTDKKRPFHVNINDVEVTVLGTHFNINSYSDESSIRTTLLEGSVKVVLASSAGSGVVLKPGQQASATGTLTVNNNVDLDQVVAWKNGLFNFNKADLPTVMRQLGRWYDVEIVYEDGRIPQLEFGGKIDRSLSLPEVLDGLKQTEVHFRQEGRKIIVTE